MRELVFALDYEPGRNEVADALADLEDAFRTADYYADCLATEDCGATQETQVLEHSEEALVLYSYWERTPVCASVPHVALDHLGDGLLFETRNEGQRYAWRIVHPGEGNVRAFFDAIEAVVGDCASIEIERLTDASSPSTGARDDDLPPEQAAALRAAVEHGYYETPREVAVVVGDMGMSLGVTDNAMRLSRIQPEEFFEP